VTYSTLQLCSGRAGFEAIPRPKLRLDLPAITARLRQQGIAVVDARVMLLIRLEHEVTLSQDGRVLIKCPDPSEASRVFARLVSLAGLPAGEPEAEPPTRLPARLIPR
jgi:hypothetical protein